MNFFSLENKTAVITGAAGHLGQSMTLALAEAGARTYAIGRTASSLEIFNHKNIIPFCADVTHEDDLKMLKNHLLTYENKLDVLINNAYSGPSIDSNLKQKFSHSYDVVVGSAALLVDSMFDLLVAAGKSSIINIASMYGMISPNPEIYNNFPQYANPAYYGASKAALIQWTRYMACHLGGTGIRVNAISPGPFPSKDIQEKTPSFIEELKQKVPMKRIGNPEELTGVILLLASNASSYITGQNIAVDGGWTSW